MQPPLLIPRSWFCVRAIVFSTLLLTLWALVGCERPFLARDGTLVFQEKGAHGAAVVTANGLEYHDRDDLPTPVVRHDANEPWRPAVGFILPVDGRLTETSRPTVVGTTGLAVALRPSDTRVPSWGGEILVRLDVIAPAAPGTARDPERLALVLDGGGEDTYALAEAAIAQLGGRDRVTVLDAHGARVVVPLMPASHRSLALAAIDKRLGDPRAERYDLAGAVARARAALGEGETRRIVVLSDGEAGELLAPGLTSELAASLSDGVALFVAAARPGVNPRALSAIASAGGGGFAVDSPLDARLTALRLAVPPAGLVVYHDVVLTFEGTPAPSHVLEASGGDVRWRLEAGELAVGDLYSGEIRTEIVRVSVPAWVPGEPFKFTVTATFDDVAREGERRSMATELPCLYDDDIERIAKSRHGDVIAYASALATLRRLDAAFVGAGVARAGGLRAIARMHARSLALLARDMHDPQIGEQAELLRSLLDATE